VRVPAGLLLFSLLVLPSAAVGADEPPPPPVVKVGWRSLSIDSATGDFGVAVTGLVQAEVGLTAEVQDEVGLSGDVTRVRSVLRAHGFGHRVSGQLQFEFIGTPRVLDARLDLHPVPFLLVTLGQQIVPVTRAWSIPLGTLAFRARSPLNTTLAPGRRFGARLAVADPEGRVSMEVGVFAPDATPGLHPAAPPMAYARWVGAPWGAPSASEVPGIQGAAAGRIALGLGALLSPGDTASQEVVSVIGDLTVQVGPLSGLVEGGFKTRLGAPPSPVWSASAALTTVLVRDRLTVGGRLLAEGRKGVPETTLLTPEVVVGLYALQHHLRLLASYGYRVRGEGAGHHALLQAQVAL